MRDGRLSKRRHGGGKNKGLFGQGTGGRKARGANSFPNVPGNGANSNRRTLADNVLQHACLQMTSPTTMPFAWRVHTLTTTRMGISAKQGVLDFQREDN